MGDISFANYHFKSQIPWNDEWPIIAEDNSSTTNVFPPINHEGLHISSSQSQRANLSDIFHQSSPETQITSSLPQLPNCRPNVTRCWFQFMHRKLTRIDSIRNYWVSHTGGIISFLLSPVAGVAAAMLLTFYCLRIRRKRQASKIMEESTERLIGIVKEKDEEIKKLLRQIAQMNKVISAAGISSAWATTAASSSAG